MGDIKAFLLPPIMEETREVVITKRAKGKDGKPIPFVLRAIDQDTNDRLIRQATNRKKVKGQTIPELDHEKYGKLLIDACVVKPNFKDAEMCAHYKTADPLDVPGRMLSSGEYAKLMQEINDLNGFSDEETLEEVAKN